MLEGTRTHALSGTSGGPSLAAAATLERLETILKRRAEHKEHAAAMEAAAMEQAMVGVTPASGPMLVAGVSLQGGAGSAVLAGVESSLDDSPLSLVVARGGVHEFLGLDDAAQTLPGLHDESAASRQQQAEGSGRTGEQRGARSKGHAAGGLWREAWTPPLTMLTWLAGRSLALRETALQETALRETDVGGPAHGLVVWVGRRVWPSLHALHRAGAARGGGGARGVGGAGGLLAASLLVDCGASNREDVPLRVWAAELASRSEACVAVVVDGRGFDRVATQRLQLACEASGSLCVLARSMRERTALSAAVTRWQVRRAEPGLDEAMRSHDVPEWVWAAGWTARLLRCKGVRPASGVRDESRAWMLRMVHDGGYNAKFGSEGQRQAGGFDLLPVLVNGSAAAADDAAAGEGHTPGRAAG